MSGGMEDAAARERALDHQVGGDHYKGFPIQPVEFIHGNGLGFLEGNVVKYVARYKVKGGMQDLLKAKHYIDLLIELEEKRKRREALDRMVVNAQKLDLYNEGPRYDGAAMEAKK